MTVASSSATPPAADPAGAGPDRRTIDAALDRAYRMLRERPDPRITLDAIRMLAAIGLGGPARELVQWSDLGSLGIDPAALRRELARIPTGRVAADAIAPQLEANLAALGRHRPDLAIDGDALRTTLADTQLYRSAAGRLHLSRRAGGALRVFLDGFADDSAVEAMALPLGAAGPAPVVTGLGAHPLVERAVEATRPAGPGPAVPVYVVDTSWQRVAWWLATADRTETFRDPRVLLFFGPDADETYGRCLAENESLLVPGAGLWVPTDDGLRERVAAIGPAILARREQALRAILAGHERRGAKRSTAAWGERLRPGATVLGFTSRSTTMLQHSMRDIGEAFEALGYRFVTAIEEADHCGHTTLTASRAAYEHDPALIVLINHLRAEQPGALGEAPVLTWIQDPVANILSRDAGATIGDRDFVCGYYAERCTGEFGYRADRVLSVPYFAISDTTFHDGPLDPDETARHGCDLMYAGHSPGRPAEVRAAVLAQYDRSLHPLIDRLYETTLARARRGEHFRYLESETFTDETARALGIDLPAEARVALGHLFTFRIFDIAYRTQTLEWAAAWAERTGRRFLLYGRGWDRHPRLAAWARGPVAHGPALRRAYRGATLTLQAAPHGFWHQRSFEALAAGSLVITRYSPADFGDRSVAEYLRSPLASEGVGTPAIFPGLETIVFDDAASFEALMEHALAHGDERDARRRAFRATVLERFTYRAVVPRLVDHVRATLTAGPGATPPAWRAMD